MQEIANVNAKIAEVEKEISKTAAKIESCEHLLTKGTAEEKNRYMNTENLRDE